MRAQIAGPALEMVGCTTSHAGVAAFIEAVKDIDGVTRVGVQGSSMTGGAGGGGNATAAGSCEGGGSAQFQMVAAFDAAPVPPSVSGEALGSEVPTPEASAEVTSSESSEATSDEASSGAEEEGAAE
jgi:hypothetical protein